MTRKNAGWIVGGICFVIGLLLIIFGFWKTLFVVALTIGGYVFGVKFLSDADSLRNLIDKIFPPGRFR
jgi:uncharacterized membrane protein